MSTDDCRGEFARLKSRGLEFETPDVLEQPRAYVAVLRDPDGNRLMLDERRAPATG